MTIKIADILYHARKKPIDHPDNSILPLKLLAIDTPADGEVPSYNQEEGKFEWISCTEKVDWAVIDDIIVETDVDYVEWTGLDINSHGAYIIFATIKNPQSETPFYNILVEEYNDPTLYYREWIQGLESSISAGRNKDACICRAGYNETTMCIVFIMRDVNGYLRAYSLETRRGGSNVINLTHAIVSTFTITNITTIRVQSTVAGAIGAGSRFILARVKSA